MPTILALAEKRDDFERINCGTSVSFWANQLVNHGCCHSFYTPHIVCGTVLGVLDNMQAVELNSKFLLKSILSPLSYFVYLFRIFVF